MSSILENIAKHVTLTPQEQELFLSKTETQHYKAKTILLNAGEVCKNSYFVNWGMLRSFNINDNIVEHVMSFACKGWWISDMYGLISQKQGDLFIEVIDLISKLDIEVFNLLLDHILERLTGFNKLTEPTVYQATCNRYTLHA